MPTSKVDQTELTEYEVEGAGPYPDYSIFPAAPPRLEYDVHPAFVLASSHTSAAGVCRRGETSRLHHKPPAPESIKCCSGGFQCTLCRDTTRLDTRAGTTLPAAGDCHHHQAPCTLSVLAACVPARTRLPSPLTAPDTPRSLGLSCSLSTSPACGPLSLAPREASTYPLAILITREWKLSHCVFWFRR